MLNLELVLLVGVVLVGSAVPEMPTLTHLDDPAVETIVMMGFSANAGRRACRAVEQRGTAPPVESPGPGVPVEEAVEWIFAHMDDPDLNDPLPAAASEPASAVAGRASDVVGGESLAALDARATSGGGAAAVSAAPTFREGVFVRLAPDCTTHTGWLRHGEVGVVLRVDETDKPYEIGNIEGSERSWYGEEDLVVDDLHGAAG